MFCETTIFQLDRVDQDQTAQNVQSDLDVHCLQKVQESCLAV